MEGKTSLEEERCLAEYFRSHPNEPGMDDIAAMFALFDTGMLIEGVTDVEPKAPKAQEQRRIALHPAWWASVAAAAVLLVAFTFSIQYLIPLHEQQSANNVVCQVAQHSIGEQPTEKQTVVESASTAESVAEPIAKPVTRPTTTKSVPRVVHKPVVAQAKPKLQPKPSPESVRNSVPEISADSVVKAVLRQNEMEVQAIYEQQLLARARAERALRRQAAEMQLMAECIARYEYTETITVW